MQSICAIPSPIFYLPELSIMKIDMLKSFTAMVDFKISHCRSVYQKFLHSIGNHKQNEKQTHRMGEIFAKHATDKGLLSKTYKQLIQLNIKKQSIQKMDRISKQMFLQRRHTDDQQAHEKKLNITNYWRNANQNYNEVSLHASQNFTMTLEKA